MSTIVIAEIGSCHGGKLSTAKEMIKVAKESGASAVKLQLFPNHKKFTDMGNIFTPLHWMDELQDMDIEVFASVFYDEGVQKLKEVGCESIKYAFAVSNQAATCYGFKKIFASYPYLADIPEKKELIPLFCLPVYPVPYHIDFEGVFPKFAGFSSHCLGIGQDINAIQHGAKYIEKHFRLDISVDCPDSRFAIKPGELETLCKEAE